jgi:type IV secretory pathway TraG/TraD family ATPase VirD4
VPVAAILDEFGTYQIQGIDDFVATARSAGVGVVAAVQDQNQLAKWYQPYSVGPMITNFRNQILLRGCSLKVAEEVSVLCGKKVVYDDVKSYGSSSAWLKARTVSNTQQRRPVEVPVKRPDEITHMAENRAILLGFTKPTEVKLCPFYEDANMRKQVEASALEMQRLASVLRSYDVKGQARPKGEVPMLRDKQLDFSLLPGVLDDSLLNEDGRQPMRKQQEKIINAKLRDLGKLKERDSMCKKATGKFFVELTAGDAKSCINFLDEYNQEGR